MQKLLLLSMAALAVTTPALANPACAVCTVAIGASLEIARKLGVADEIVGLWAGALLTLVGYWTILFFDKKKWHFKGRDAILMLASVGMIGFIYVREVVYNPVVIWNVFYLDPILFSSLLGSVLFVYSEKFYQYLKARNGGHAHFPFEKVAMPVAWLGIASLYFTYFPISM